MQGCEINLTSYQSGTVWYIAALWTHEVKPYHWTIEDIVGDTIMKVIPTNDEEEEEEKKEHNNNDYYYDYNYNYNNTTTELNNSTIKKRQETSANTDIDLVDKYNSKVRVQKYSSGKATATSLPLQIYYLFNHNCFE